MCEFCEDKKKLETLKELIGVEPDYCPVCGQGFVIKRVLDHLKKALSAHLGEDCLSAPKEFYNMSTDGRWTLADIDISKECAMLGVDLAEELKE